MRLSSINNLISSLSTGRRGIFFQYFVLLISALLGIMAYGLVHIYGFTIFPDEFGYWSTAASNIGYDWSDVASIGSYYAFGYSIVLTPILYIFGGGVAAYRTAIFINMLLQGLSLFILKGIMNRIYPQMPKIDAVYCIAFAVFYPVWSLYVQMTLVEALLMFLFSLTVYLMICFLDKPTIWRAGLLIVPLALMYFMHMRTIGVIASAILVLVLWALKNPKYRKFIIIALGAIGIVAVIAVILKLRVQKNVYSNADENIMAGNDFSGQIYTIKYMFTWEGMKKLALGIIGKLFYLCEASFGTFFIAMWLLIKQSILLFRRWKWKYEIKTKQYVCFFILLSLVAQLLITAAYMNNPQRLDSITYGRYNDYILPIIMCLGIRQVMRCRHKLRYFIEIAVVSGVFVAITMWYSSATQLKTMNSFFVAGISYFWDYYNFDIVSDYLISWVTGTVMIAVVFACIHFSRRRGKLTQLMNVIIVIEIVLALVLSKENIFISSEIDRVDSRVATYIMTHGSDEADVYYVNEVGRNIVDVLQFQLESRKIHVIEKGEVKDKLKPGDYLITDYDSKIVEEESKEYTLNRHTVWFKLYTKE